MLAEAKWLANEFGWINPKQTFSCEDPKVKRQNNKLPPEWSAYGRQMRGGTQSRTTPAWAYAAAGLGLGSIIGLGIFLWPATGSPVGTAGLFVSNGPAVQRSFTICHTGGGTNCVVDGDTIWMEGTKIRVADIDAPETHPPRCGREADLGNRATQRLYELVNAGPFTAEQVGNRDVDRYGRKLRVLVRNGKSLGDELVSEGLARTWDGARHPWC